MKLIKKFQNEGAITYEGKGTNDDESSEENPWLKGYRGMVGIASTVGQTLGLYASEKHKLDATKKLQNNFTQYRKAVEKSNLYRKAAEEAANANGSPLAVSQLSGNSMIPYYLEKQKLINGVVSNKGFTDVNTSYIPEDNTNDNTTESTVPTEPTTTTEPLTTETTDSHKTMEEVMAENKATVDALKYTNPELYYSIKALTPAPTLLKPTLQYSPSLTSNLGVKNPLFTV